jgi:hypothetical protein
MIQSTIFDLKSWALSHECVKVTDGDFKRLYNIIEISLQTMNVSYG